MEPNHNNQNNQNTLNNQTPQNTTPPNVINASAGNYHNPVSNPSTNMDSNPTPQNPPKKSHSALYGMIFFAILAAAGIGFGVWAMMDGNNQVAKKDEQISDLRSQLAEAKQPMAENDTILNIETSDNENNYRNPVIKSNDSETIYRVGFQSSHYINDSGQGYVLKINLKDGGLDSCSIYKVDGAFDSDCVITGVNGEISRVVEFGEGQSNVDSNIGFIMADGTVQYFPFAEAMKNKDFSIKGQLNISGFVTDIFDITVGISGGSGYGSTAFVLSDGSFLIYDKSMLQ